MVEIKELRTDGGDKNDRDHAHDWKEQSRRDEKEKVITLTPTPLFYFLYNICSIF